ncbi:MAG: hypothetical protein U0930_02380 [Pirellulales bacterium]
MSREAKLGMEIDPANPEARTYAAYLFAKGKIDDGIKRVDKAIAVCPKMAAALLFEGAMPWTKKVSIRTRLNYGMAIKINDQIPVTSVSRRREPRKLW